MGKTVNVILKDKNGEPVTYTGIDTVKLPTDTGEAAAFTLGGTGGSEQSAAPVFRLETAADGKLRIALQGGSYMENELDAEAVSSGVRAFLSAVSGEVDPDVSKFAKVLDKKLVGTVFGKLKENLGRGVQYPRYALRVHIPAESVRAMIDSFALPGLDLDAPDTMMDRVLDAWNGSDTVDMYEEVKDTEPFGALLAWMMEIVPEVIEQVRSFLKQPDALEALDLALPCLPTGWNGVVNTVLGALAQPGVSLSLGNEFMPSLILKLLPAVLDGTLSGFAGRFAPKVLARKAAGELAAVDAIGNILRTMGATGAEDIEMIVNQLLSVPGVYMEVYALACGEGNAPSEKSNAVQVSRAVLGYGEKTAQTEVFTVGGESFCDDGENQAKGKLLFALEGPVLVDMSGDGSTDDPGSDTLPASGSASVSISGNRFSAYYWQANLYVSTSAGSGTKKYTLTLPSSADLPEGAVWYLYDTANKRVLDIDKAVNSNSLRVELTAGKNYYLRFVGCGDYGKSLTVTAELVTSLSEKDYALGVVRLQNSWSRLEKGEEGEVNADSEGAKYYTGTVAAYVWQLRNKMGAVIITDDNGVYFGAVGMEKEERVKARLLGEDGTEKGSVTLTGVGTESESAGAGTVSKPWIDGGDIKVWPLAGASAKDGLESCTLELTLGEKTAYKAFVRMGVGNMVSGISAPVETVRGVHDADADTVTLDTVQNGAYMALEAEPETAAKPVLRFVIKKDSYGNVTGAGLEDAANEGASYILYAGGKVVGDGISKVPGYMPGEQNYTAAAYNMDKLLSAQSEPVQIGVYHLALIYDDKPSSSSAKSSYITLWRVNDPVVRTSEGDSVLSGEHWVFAGKEAGSSNVSYALLEDGKHSFKLTADTETAELKKAVCASRSVMDTLQSDTNKQFPDGVNLLQGAKAYTGSGVSFAGDVLTIDHLREDVFMHFVLTEKPQETTENAETANEAAE